MRSVFTARSVAMARVPLTPIPSAPTSGLLAEGIFLASRSLEQVGPSPRAAPARAAYALRAATRTTPNGVWCAAGVAAFDGPNAAPIRWNERHRTTTLPAPDWLLAVADHLLDGALPGLAVTSNNLAVRRGERWEAAHPGVDGDTLLGSVAATDLSDWLLATCAEHTSVHDLLAHIHRRYPDADEAKAHTALTQLIRTGLLLTDLLPEDLRADPLHHLVQRLGKRHHASTALAELRDLLSRADTHQAGSSQRLALLQRARTLADEFHVVERPLIVDTTMDGALRLPTGIGARAAEAASLLWRIGHRTGPLESWTRRFTDLYGRQRLVPLLEAVDPAVGVGPPASEDAMGAGSNLDDKRARHLAALYTDALARGRPEIALTDHDIRQLHSPGGAPPPPTGEIHVRLVGQSDGALTLVVGPHAAQDAGSAAARLGHLLPGLLPLTTPEAVAGRPVPAEIVCRPLTARAAGLTSASGTLAHRIPVGVPARDGDLRPADLAIASTDTHLILWSRQLAAPVRPVLLSRIARNLLPPAAQLLHLLGHAGERPWHPFSWAPALPYAPYTPRVTFRGTVLTPQRWRMPDDLTQAAGRRTAWRTRLEEWISHVQPPVPDLVLAEESDRHLLIDLTRPGHREILRRTVAAGTRILAEALGYAPLQAPLKGSRGRHLLELVVPLDRRVTDPAAPTLSPRTGARPLRSDHTSIRDGWISVALAVPVRHQDAALVQLPNLPDTLLSYWLRYHNAALGPHLRVRARAHTAAGRTELLDLLTGWAAQLADQRLSDGLLHTEPYLRETQRYGGTKAIETAEAAFAADSGLALSTLHLDQSARLILAARTIKTIATTLAPAQAKDAARAEALAVADRRQRDSLRVRTPEPTETTLPHAIQGAHRAVLHDLAGLLKREVAPGVASDLIHMHCNRLLGLDAGAERIARSLALDLLHRS
jgi:thiopeptide-type bacteriocin biosynthesis protein